MTGLQKLRAGASDLAHIKNALSGHKGPIEWKWECQRGGRPLLRIHNRDPEGPWFSVMHLSRAEALALAKSILRAHEDDDHRPIRRR